MSSIRKSAASNRAKERAHYEPLAWWLARERIGHDLRERYAVLDELPVQIVKLAKKIDEAESNRSSQDL